jgi:UDP-glucose 4-epimerase
MRKKVVITGGAGFIGAALANSLSKDFDVTAIDNLSAGEWHRLNPGIEKIELDISTASIAELTEAFRDAEYLCHLAAVKLHNVKNAADEVIRTNIVGTGNVLEAAGCVQLKRVLFTSSLYAYGSLGPKVMNERDLPVPTTVYGASKLIGEQMMTRASGLFEFSTVSARLFFIYGPGQYAEGGYKSVIVKTCEKFNAAKPALINGDGKQSLDYVYIDDCVLALKKLLLSDLTGTYNVSSGQSVSVNELVETIGRFSLSHEVEFAEADWTAHSIRYGDNSKIQNDLAWKPEIALSEGLQRTWKFYSERKVD